ncbi:MAG: hypothetical protein L6Q80_14685 [Dehalococcoidia bacterium]|nr:hypothetical protein [Dehalococcoidia bacterium]
MAAESTKSAVKCSSPVRAPLDQPACEVSELSNPASRSVWMTKPPTAGPMAKAMLFATP